MPKIGLQAVLEVTPQGAKFPDAWITVATGISDGKVIEFMMEAYASEVAYDAGYRPLLNQKFSIPYQQGDLVSILYQYLMTLNIDQSTNPAPDQRLKVDLTTATLINRPDPAPPVLPEAQPL